MISNNNSQIVNNKAIFNTRLVETINEIDKVADRIIIVMPTHTNGWDVVARVHKVSKFTSNYQDLEQYLRIPYEPINLRLDEINQIFHEEMKRSDKMVLINPIEHTCDITGHTCFGVRNDQILFADEDHLSSYMNDLIVAEIYSVMGHTRGDENLR